MEQNSFTRLWNMSTNMVKKAKSNNGCVICSSGAVDPSIRITYRMLQCMMLTIPLICKGLRSVDWMEISISSWFTPGAGSLEPLVLFAINMASTLEETYTGTSEGAFVKACAWMTSVFKDYSTYTYLHVFSSKPGEVFRGEISRLV